MRRQHSSGGLEGGRGQPLAVAIMSGLIFSTALTLGFVPLLYSVFYRVSFRDFVYAETSSEPVE